MLTLADFEQVLLRRRSPVAVDALFPSYGRGVADWKTIMVKDVRLEIPENLGVSGDDGGDRPSLFVLMGVKNAVRKVRARSIAAVRLLNDDAVLSGLDFMSEMTGVSASDIRALTDWDGAFSLRIAPTLRWDENGLVEGWAFGVTKAFESSLDLRWEDVFINKTPHRVYTEGFPRLVSFQNGDFLHSPAQYARDLRPWGEVLPNLHSSVQILEATNDNLDDLLPFTVKDGVVRFRWIKYKDGRRIGETEHQLTQREFLGFLQTGKMPGKKGDLPLFDPLKTSPATPSQGVFSGF